MRRRASRQNKDNEESEHQEGSGTRLSDSLEDNIKLLKDVFKNDDTVVLRRFMNSRDNNIKGCIIFIDGMVDVKVINKSIIEPIMTCSLKAEDYELIDIIEYSVTTACQTKHSDELKKLCDAVIKGSTVLLVDNEPHGLIIDTKGYKTKGIEDVETEKTTKGPKEGFTETLLTNLSMIRRKLNTSDLKFKFMSFGRESETSACICYLEGIAEPELIEEVEKRLEKVKLKGVLSTQSIGEMISDAKLSPFKTIGDTQKPDVVAANLLEGRVALLLDGTPSVITMPYLFMENFQFAEDYYTNYYVGSLDRILSYLAFFISISLPGVYVAITCFHQEVLATQLFMSVAVARQGIPFPTSVVTLLLIIVFEILKDATARVPSYISQSLTIVGTLIIGQAAVDARLVGAPTLIIVSVSEISRLLLPKLDNANIILTVILLILSSILGLYGFTAGIIGLSIHLFSLESFGRSYLSHVDSYQTSRLKDVYARLPAWENASKKNRGGDSKKNDKQ